MIVQVSSRVVFIFSLLVVGLLLAMGCEDSESSSSGSRLTIQPDQNPLAIRTFAVSGDILTLDYGGGYTGVYTRV